MFSPNVWRQLSDECGELRIITENPSRRFYHPCSAEDYIEVLEQLPNELTKYVRVIVLRRTSVEDEKMGVDARLRYSCVLMNAFPKSNETIWTQRPTKATMQHLAPWCERWKSDGDRWRLVWEPDEVRRYYLYHVFLHEVGHINQPYFNSGTRRESFAENFALEWARKLGALR